jgi:hypothetical protein
MTVYWAGVLFALGIGLPMSQSLSEDNGVVVAILLLLFFIGASLLSWVMAGILIGCIWGAFLNRKGG